MITFHGFGPQSKSGDRFLQLRGLVTIAFFGLDDVSRRKSLRKERIAGPTLDALRGVGEAAGVRIDGFTWLPDIVDKIARKHRLEQDEAEEVFFNRPRCWFVER